MLTSDQNTLFVQSGPGTPGGDLLRRYWQPVALTEELPAGGPPRRVTILGEHLALFRDEHGRPGLLGLHCSHRGADLSYGRVEDGGLRCLYHGWVYDVTGACLAQPGEPNEENFRKKIKHLSYPCREVGGLILAYLGPDPVPLLPAYDFWDATDDQRWVSKIFQDCNHQQGLEGAVDPQHVSVLHETFDSNFRDKSFGRDDRPRIDIDLTGYGVRIAAIREPADGPGSLRVTNFVMPNLGFFPGVLAQPDGYQVEWRVPIDDTTHWKYILIYKPSGLPDRERIRQYTLADIGPDYRPTRTAANRYRQDRTEMATRTAAGFGYSFQIQDTWAAESQGRIFDRSKEHLGYTDRAMMAMRRFYLAAIKRVQEGGEPPHVIRTPDRNAFPDLITVDWPYEEGRDWRAMVEDGARRARTTVATGPGADDGAA